MTHHHLAWLHDEETAVYYTAGEHGRYIAYRTKDDPTSPDEGLYTLRHRPAPEDAWITLGSFPTFEAVKLAADMHEHAISGP